MTDPDFPLNPILCEYRRSGAVESVHRGSWCLVDTAGDVLDGAGDLARAHYTRSSIKSLQALPLFKTGAAARFGFEDDEVTLAIASHNGEPCHTERVASTLARLGLSEADLRCGTQLPDDADTRFQLRVRGARPSQLHNNCSGKHAGFLALSLHLDADPAGYLEPDSPGQTLVREAVASMSDTPAAELVPGIDGCSAPNYRLPLPRLALAFARLSNPDGLPVERRAHCERMTASAARHPELVAGTRGRLDTDLLRATKGRLFPKVGAEAVYAIGLCGGDRALAVKIDDAGERALWHVVLALCERFAFLSAAEREALTCWWDPVLRNRADREVGEVRTPLG